MKVTIPKTGLLKALQPFSGVVECSINIEAHRFIKIECRFPNTVTISRFNSKISLTRRIRNSNVEEPGIIAVSFSDLFKCLNCLPDGLVSVSSDKLHGLVSSGSTEIKLPGYPTEKLPDIPDGGFEPGFVLDAGILKQMIKGTGYVIDELDFLIGGALLEVGLNFMRMVATDSHRISFVTYKGKVNGPGTPLTFLIRAMALDLIPKIFIDGDVSLSHCGSHIYFQDDTTTLTVKMSENRFPYYRRVVPVGNTFTIEVGKAALLKSITGVIEECGPGFKAVYFIFSENNLQLKWCNDDETTVFDVEIEYTGLELKTAFNAAYISEFLEQAKADRIKIGFNKAGSAFTFTQEGSLEFQYAIMPLYIAKNQPTDKDPKSCPRGEWINHERT